MTTYYEVTVTDGPDGPQWPGFPRHWRGRTADAVLRRALAAARRQARACGEGYGPRGEPLVVRVFRDGRLEAKG